MDDNSVFSLGEKNRRQFRGMQPVTVTGLKENGFRTQLFLPSFGLRIALGSLDITKRRTTAYGVENWSLPTG